MIIKFDLLYSVITWLNTVWYWLKSMPQEPRERWLYVPLLFHNVSMTYTIMLVNVVKEFANHSKVSPFLRRVRQMYRKGMIRCSGRLLWCPCSWRLKALLGLVRFRRTINFLYKISSKISIILYRGFKQKIYKCYWVKTFRFVISLKALLVRKCAVSFRRSVYREALFSESRCRCFTVMHRNRIFLKQWTWFTGKHFRLFKFTGLVEYSISNLISKG